LGKDATDTARQRAILEFISDYKKVASAIEGSRAASGSVGAPRSDRARLARDAKQLKKLLLSIPPR
jgi:hypothetical protein